MEKAAPHDVANAILDGLESGAADIFPDNFAEDFGQLFQTSPKGLEERMAAMVVRSCQ